ncbi:MAG: VanW family protein [Armatimonadota bacterium]
MFRKFKIPVIAAIVLVCIIAGAAAAISNGNTIYKGVSIGGIDTGGMTVEQAVSDLQPEADKLSEARITLKYDKESKSCTIADLGGVPDIEASVKAAYSVGRNGNIIQRIYDVMMLTRNKIDIPINYKFDDKKTAAFIHALAAQINRDPRNAGIVPSGGSVRITSEKPGIKMDTSKSINNILAALKSGKGEAVLAVSTVAPKIRTADLKKINGKLASYSTVFKPWQKNRTYNLMLACKAINGYIFKPGEIFSYNKVVGPREKKFGFRDAPIFVNGEVEEDTGGGICQVSSTLYNAALLANLKISRRAPHSRPVVYAPVGRDATVAFPSIDFRILNNTKAPIYIAASIGKRTVNITLYGMKTPGLDIELVSAGHKITKPPVKEITDGTLLPGKRVVRESGRSGHRVTTYRIIKQNGKVLKKELISTDTYRPEARVVAVARPVEIKDIEIIPQSVDN